MLWDALLNADGSPSYWEVKCPWGKIETLKKKVPQLLVFDILGHSCEAAVGELLFSCGLAVSGRL